MRWQGSQCFCIFEYYWDEKKGESATNPGSVKNQSICARHLALASDRDRYRRALVENHAINETVMFLTEELKDEEKRKIGVLFSEEGELHVDLTEISPKKVSKIKSHIQDITSSRNIRVKWLP